MYDFKLRPQSTAEDNQRTTALILIVAEAMQEAHVQGRPPRPPKPRNFPDGFAAGPTEVDGQPG